METNELTKSFPIQKDAAVSITQFLLLSKTRWHDLEAFTPPIQSKLLEKLENIPQGKIAEALSQILDPDDLEGEAIRQTATLAEIHRALNFMFDASADVDRQSENVGRLLEDYVHEREIILDLIDCLDLSAETHDRIRIALGSPHEFRQLVEHSIWNILDNTDESLANWVKERVADVRERLPGSDDLK